MTGTAPKESYTRPEVRRVLGLTERQLQSWERHGLIPTLEQFALAEINVLRNLRDLRRSRVPLSAICLAVEAMRRREQGSGDPLKAVKFVTEGRRVRVEIGGRRMEPVSGQMVLDFDAATLRRLVSFPSTDKAADRRAKREAAEALFQKGLELEHSGAPVQEAIAAYEAAVRADAGSAGAWLNLGTIHFNARSWAQAERFYKRALEADPEYPLAHFNLANLYDERGDWARALDHYNMAIKLNPGYADAHYNIALLYQNRGRTLEALRHWRVYLKLDGTSEWAEIARRESEKLRKSTVVEGRSRFKVVGESD